MVKVPPRKHVVQYYAEKVESPNLEKYDYDSDEESTSGDMMGEEGDEEELNGETRPHDRPNSYAWILIRLGTII